MITPNTVIFEALKTIDGVASVAKPSSNVFAELPVLTYSVSNNQVNGRTLENEIIAQNVECTIDIWTEKSVEATELLVQVEAVMRALFYNLEFAGEMPNPNNDVYHISCRFRATNVC